MTSISQKISSRIRLYLALLAGITIMIGCEQESQAPVLSTAKTETEQAPATTDYEHEPVIHAQTDNQFSIGNKHYLYDISEHTIDELKSLLQRAKEINDAESERFEDLEIVMILHGPDIDWFTLDNYENNKELVDLAKQLDAFEVIDLKVCETTMDKLEIDRSQIPTFIESVPFAPDEINRLTQEGYTHL